MEKKAHTDKVALITGAARRIGAEIARTLHAAGMNIILHYRISKEEAENLCAELNNSRAHSAVTIRADLQEPEREKMLIQEALAPWKRLDVLVNNAAHFYRTAIGKVTAYEWDDLMMVNLKLPFFLAQEAAPHLAKTQGTIINISDIHGVLPLRDYAVYCISKAGLLMMTNVLAKELAPNVRVNAVAPGVVLWPEGENVLPEEQKQEIIKRTPLGHIGSPKDIADAVLFLVQNANYVTGQVLKIDGGRAL